MPQCNEPTSDLLDEQQYQEANTPPPETGRRPTTDRRGCRTGWVQGHGRTETPREQETVEALAAWLADAAGRHTSCPAHSVPPGPEDPDAHRWCRQCWITEVATRMREAVQRERHAAETRAVAAALQDVFAVWNRPGPLATGEQNRCTAGGGGVPPQEETGG